MKIQGRRISLDHLFEKSPENTKRVTRSSRWGNPFKIGAEFTREESIKQYEKYLSDKLEEDSDFLEPLKGKRLACFCDIDQDCHVNVLLEYVD